VAESLDALGLRIDRMETILNGVHTNTSQSVIKELPAPKMPTVDKEEEKEQSPEPITRSREGSIITKPPQTL
jgi:hypothetical protein